MNGTKYVYDPAQTAANRILFHGAGNNYSMMVEIIREEMQKDFDVHTDAIRALPLTAPATEAGGLGAEGVAQQAKDRIQEVLNGVLQRKEEYFLDDRYCRWGIVQRNLNESVDATVAALAHAAPEPDTLRERVERLAGEIDATANCGPGECNERDSYRHIAAELRALLQTPAREGGEHHE